MSCGGAPSGIPCYTAQGSRVMSQSSLPSCYPPPNASTTPYVPKPAEPGILGEGANACRVKYLEYRTEQSCVSWVKRFILFHDKCYPREMGSTEVRAFLSHLAVNRRLAESTQDQALGAILFLYRHVLQQPLGSLDTVRAS